MGLVPIRKALISVSDRRGLDSLALALKEFGVEIYSTSGTASYLNELKVPVKSVESLSGFPAILGGRVKTLSPVIFGGILARRSVKSDQEEAARHGVALFDLVVVNFYPFGQHLGEAMGDQAEFMDIGGPCMARAAAKNHEWVVALSDPEDYEALLLELQKNNGQTSKNFRQRMAAHTVERTCRYDAMIASQWKESDSLPNVLDLSQKETLRYGENPHQQAAWCRQPDSDWKLLQGKELSYNNLLDTDAAFRLVHDFEQPCVAIIKHNNPCGVAAGQESGRALFQRAMDCDAQSAFGGIVAYNGSVDGEFAEALAEIFLEVVVAKGFSEEARERLLPKKNLRLIEWPHANFLPFEFRNAMGGVLLQQLDGEADEIKKASEVTGQRLRSDLLPDLEVAWRVVKHVRSNAIVLVKDRQTVGIGAGQMSRVDAVEIALRKAGSKANGAVLASDAFFPFRDNIDRLAGIGIAAIVQPGGSKRDGEVIEACKELHIPMLFTGSRHFRH